MNLLIRHNFYKHSHLLQAKKFENVNMVFIFNLKKVIFQSVLSWLPDYYNWAVIVTRKDMLEYFAVECCGLAS